MVEPMLPCWLKDGLDGAEVIRASRSPEAFRDLKLRFQTLCAELGDVFACRYVEVVEEYENAFLELLEPFEERSYLSLCRSSSLLFLLRRLVLVVGCSDYLVISFGYVLKDTFFTISLSCLLALLHFHICPFQKFMHLSCIGSFKMRMKP